MVSIVLPNLNTPLGFLEERIKSIIDQTYINWTCIIIDGFSNNGSAEYLKKICKQDTRFTYYEKPRKGIYDAWNEGIKLAKNKYVYIATSDDTMLPTLLQTMVNELEINADCGLAHCGLVIIDENSKPVADNQWDNYWNSQYFGPLNKKKHKRMAPHDGVLHMAVQTVYTSVTQLLIRKSLFDGIGLFKTDCGPIADFEWGMRASLLTNVIHVPESLATWRVHDQQATSENYNASAKHRNDLCELATKALLTYQQKNPDGYKQLNKEELFYVFRRDQFYYELVTEEYKSNKLKFYLKWSRLYPAILKDHIFFKLKLKNSYFDRITYIKNYIRNIGLEKNIVILP